MPTKICSKCGVEKNFEEYSKDSKKKDGRFSACKACEKIRRKKWEAENAEHVKDVRHFYNQTHKEEIKEYNDYYYKLRHDYHIKRKRQYTLENRDVINEKKRLKREANIEMFRAKDRKWAHDNPEKCRQKVMRRLAIKRGATVGKVSYPEILERYGWICHICGQPIENRKQLHFDHVIPLSKGGSHSMDNILPSHALCNIKKADKILS